MSSPIAKKFEAAPVTIVITRPVGEETWIGSILDWEAGDGVPYVATLYAMSDARWFPMTQLDEVAPLMWQGRLATMDGDDGDRFIIRPTVEADAVSSITMSGMPSVPMPLDVISSIHASNGEFQMPTLWAMSDDEGFVATLMLNSDAGLFVRYSGGWHRILDEDAVDGLNVTEVDDAALEMFDQFDRAGQMVALSSMPQNGKPVPAAVQGEPDIPGGQPEPVIRDVPVLASAADLPEAIIAAGDDSGLQWYVERRAKALGLSSDFPWT